MKKLLKVLAVVVLAITPLVIGSSASAQSVCQIGYTGPDSQNLCRSVTKYACSVSNRNEVDIKDESNQVVASGTVGNSGNNQGGNATSGSVTNNNGTVFAITITNPGINGTCTATAVVPATEPPTPTTPTTPTVPLNPVQPTANGGGAGVLALPKTDGNFTSTVLIVVAGVLASISVLGVGGIALYRYYKSL